MVAQVVVVREPQLVMVLVDRDTPVGNGLNPVTLNQLHRAVGVVQVDNLLLHIQIHHGLQGLAKAVLLMVAPGVQVL